MSTLQVDIGSDGKTEDAHMEKGVSNGLRIRPWRELALLSAIVMELSWLTLWYRLFIPASQKVPYLVGLPVLLGMLLAVYIPVRLMALLDTKLRVRRLILLLVVALNIVVGLKLLLHYNQPISLGELLNQPVRTFGDMARLIPPEFITMLFVLLVSWRGISFSERHVGPISMISGFRLGIVMFILYGLLLPAIGEQANLALFIFLFFSLLTLCSARIAVLSQMRGGQHIRFNRQWMLGIAAIIAVMVGLSALAISITTHQLFEFLSQLLTWFTYLLVLILTPALWIVLRFFMWLFETIRLEALFEGLRNVFSILENLLKGLSQWMAGLTSRFNFEAIRIFLNRLTEYKSFYLWVILLIGLGVVLLTLRRYVLKGDDVDEQEAESADSQENLFNQLRNALRRSLGKLANNLEDIFRLNQARRLLAAARIRRIYASLLVMSARLDRPRHTAQTPLEFLPSLEGLFPGLSKELGTITQAYLLVRYGELPETAGDLEEVEAAWKQVSAAGQDQLKARRRSAS